MASEGVCDVCKGNMVFSEERDMGGSKYRILKCDKCKKQVVRRVE